MNVLQGKQMNEWRTVAIEMLPEIKSEIVEAESPMALWVEIIFYFDEAYEEPKKEDFIRRVYAYADWCLGQDQGETADEHLPTCVVVCFWEHLPTYKPARDDMPRWFSFGEIMANQEIFKRSMSEEEFETLKGLYAKSKDSEL